MMAHFTGMASLIRLQRRTPAIRFFGVVFLAFIPAAIIGLLSDSWISQRLFNPFSVAMALIAGGIIMLWAENFAPRKPVVLSKVDNLDNLSPMQALTIGLWQIFSLWPGMSRSMTTIVGATSVGLSRRAAAEFSFILGAVTLGAASFYKAIKHHDAILSLGVMPVFAGLLAAFISAFIVVKLFVGLLTRFGLRPWAYYRFMAAGGYFIRAVS